VVERNLKADLNYNFEEINLTLQESTMNLLKSLLKKDPSQRISALQALKHEAFENVSINDDTVDVDDNDAEN
jgi:serine/threonine protein kinase